MKTFLFSLFSLILLSHCSESSSPEAQQINPAPASPKSNLNPTKSINCDAKLSIVDKNEPTSDWDKRWWFDKVHRRLAPGAVINRSEKENLLKQSRVEILDQLMARPEFLDATMSFNLFFLGFREDSIRNSDSSYSFKVFDFPNALESAKAVADTQTSSHNYFSLFNLYATNYAPPLNTFLPRDSKKVELTLEQRHELRKALADEILLKLKIYLEQVTSETEFDSKKFCESYTKEDLALKLFQDYGLPVNVAVHEQLGSNRLQQIANYCRDSKEISKEHIAEELQKTVKYMTEFFEISDGFDPLFYKVQNLNDVKVFRFPTESKKQSLQFGLSSRISLTNSSTNMNRKRSAYILKNFFCDDLTPIQVQTPTEHTTGQHGSDTSCFACHYKLDPMAGFFKDYGAFMFDFADPLIQTSKKPAMITFDDGAIQNLNDYEANWLNPSNTKNKWNIGYVRSTNHSDMNDYGENLDDLFKIIQKAPEVRRCLTKRMFAYETSEQQTVDAGYLDYLASRFTQTATCENSAQAYRNLVKEVLLSASFMARDPVADRCYDFAPGYDAKDAAPCKVNAILARNCTECHSASANESNLDLSHWLKQTNGEFNFSHVDDSGQQRTQVETMQIIQDRLQTTNSKKRMPKDHFINPIDQADLFNWTVEVLQKSRHGVSK